MTAMAACTIVSKNYLAYARTLCQSLKKFNPDIPFYVLLVDELGNVDFDIQSEPYELIEVRNIGIENFKRVAFRFNILELNTNVKPRFLKFLLENRDVQKVLYFDPDILITSSIGTLFDSLEANQIILTPHCISPINDDLRPSEQDYLSTGVFNLGFIGVKNTLDVLSFLDWWSNRCLTLGFQEIRTGLFVDQKWCNFVPCFFKDVGIMKNPGWNMAYWNLHERILSKKEDGWIVNDRFPLVFFHFSGFSINDMDRISRHTNRYDLSSRPDLKDMFSQYKSLLKTNEMERFKSFSYQYGFFSNGEKITQLARSLFSANESKISDTDPFSSSGKVYFWCKRSHFLGGIDSAEKYTAANLDPNDYRIKFIHGVLRFLLKILGVERYSLLMKYLSFVTILRNQMNVYKFK